MTAALTDEALDQVFGKARSIHAFLPRKVDATTLQRLYDLVKLGPTGFNAQPARFLFIRSDEAKRRLAPALSSGNRAKTLAAPVNALVAWDGRFPDRLPKQFPANDAKGFFDANPDWVERAGVSNAWLQAAYLIVAARGLGLDAGPMTGFDAAALDAAFFPDGRFRSLLVINLGYGDRTGLGERGPRLAFADAVAVL